MKNIFRNNIKTGKLKPLLKNTGIAETDVRLIRFAALLHDVCHHPFSHALDKIIPDDHENYSAILVKYLQKVFKLAQPFIQP
jgi:HD superfamily phosphohydrolase